MKMHDILIQTPWMARKRAPGTNAAYQAHLENVTGSIEVGKSAEMVLLDRDIETTPVDQIQDIKVLETVFKGKTVFKKA